jgi:hypothetical protein
MTTLRKHKTIKAHWFQGMKPLRKYGARRDTTAKAQMVAISQRNGLL